MKKIRVKLNRDFKQFHSGYETELHGNLIILSGVNGSGKSQFMQILSGNTGVRSTNGQKVSMDSEVSIDDEKISFDLISKRSFIDNIRIENFAHSATPSIGHKEQAWKHFSNGQNWVHPPDYKKSKQIIMDIFIKAGFDPHAKFDPWTSSPFNKISKQEFEKLLPDDFIWRNDDPFSNTIADLFYESAAKRIMLQAEHGSGKREGLFDNQSFLETAPWTILNHVFETLKFNYRFKTDMEFLMPHLKEAPTLYTLVDGRLNELLPRELSELSDGEKTIISFTFALLNEKLLPDKILLLDEIDNTLNPSLIEAFFSLLDEYFIKNGLIVIMTTHSPATISLAPDYASFYEIFRQDNASPLIKPVGREEYEELRIANKEFYAKIESSENRILELEAKYQEVNGNLKILFVEDCYTQIYKLAWLKLNGHQPTAESLETDFESNADFRIYSKGNKDNLYGYLNNPSMQECENQRIVGLFDFDDAYDCFERLKKNKSWSEIQGTENEGLYRIRTGNDIFALVLPVPEHRKAIAGKDQKVKCFEVELLFTDEQIKKIYPNDCATETITPDLVIPKIKNKEDFWKKALILDQNDFCAFKALFDRINMLLDIED